MTRQPRPIFSLFFLYPHGTRRDDQSPRLGGRDGQQPESFPVQRPVSQWTLDQDALSCLSLPPVQQQWVSMPESPLGRLPDRHPCPSKPRRAAEEIEWSLDREIPSQALPKLAIIDVLGGLEGKGRDQATMGRATRTSGNYAAYKGGEDGLELLLAVEPLCVGDDGPGRENCPSNAHLMLSHPPLRVGTDLAICFFSSDPWVGIATGRQNTLIKSSLPRLL